MPHRAVDEDDVVVSTMKSFYAVVRDRRLEPSNRNGLWKLLATITARKATTQLRLHYADKLGGNIRGESVLIDHAGPDESPLGIST